MKILLVSWYFPPSNTIAAVRIGKLAKYLAEQGHDIKVLTARNPPYRQSLPVETSADVLVLTAWKDVNAFPKNMARIIGKPFRSKPKGLGPREGHRADAKKRSGPPKAVTAPPKSGKLGKMYELLVNFPDERVGWFPYAVMAGRKLLRQWQPEVVFASGPPFTTLLIAYVLSKTARLPLVVEFRDRWSNDPYYPPPRWRAILEQWLEHKIVSRTAGLTTVSEPWAEAYRRSFNKPTQVIFNGYDAGDYDARDFESSSDPESLKIVYTGGIYPGKRDPSPLFEAIRHSEKSGWKISVSFYGTDEQHVIPLAEKYGVRHLVEVNPSVTHAEAMRLQQRADILLLMQWDDPKEQGNVPGKFFEYLGALRPILVLGLKEGVPASIVHERDAGFSSTDTREIAVQLETWCRTKREKGRIPALPEQARHGFSRSDQFAKFVPFLQGILQ